MKRDFEKWLLTMKNSIASWNYYIDFDKVYEKVKQVKDELNILNSLIGEKNIEEEFKRIINKYPNTLKAIPILLAKREAEIKVNTVTKEYTFNFIEMNYSIDQYVLFMKNSGLFELLQNHIINNLVDYVLGIEVGMDTNGRKNRTGHVMEDLVESYLIKAGLKKNKTYFKEIYSSEIEERFNLNLSKIRNEGKVEKKFDFAFVGALNNVFACECNFYSSQGSKLNETARSYKTIALEAKKIKNFHFVWFTDGIGWKYAKGNLEETFDVLEDIYNLSDLENGAIEKLIKAESYISDIMK